MSTDTEPQNPHPSVGKMFGSYEVKAVLGEGGMGEVFLAEHERLGRQVALKRLKDRFAKNRKAVKRFVDEAWAIGQIQHGNIVKVTDFVLGENDVYYIMELLEGQTLAEELHDEGALAAERAADIADKVASALAAVHDKGFVHADIKPSNIFLARTPDGGETVKLLDFGIASLKGGEDATEDNTAAQLVTPVYMSPEQADGQTTSSATDLYSLGAVLYHMLVGAPPFEAATFAEYVYKHTHETPPAPRLAAPGSQPLSTALQRTVLRCLEKNPAARFPSARALREALKASPLSEPEAGPAQRLLLGTDRTGVLTRLCLLSGVVALLVTLLTGLVGSGDHAHKATSEPTGPRRVASADAGVHRAPAVGAMAPVALVVLRVQSEPSRATVRRLSPKPRILGLTPLTLQAPRGEQWTLQVLLEGYEPQLLQLSLAADATRRVVLQPVKPTANMARPTPPVMRWSMRPPPMVQPVPVDPMGIIDPFDTQPTE